MLQGACSLKKRTDFHLKCHFPHFSSLEVLNDILVEVLFERAVRLAVRVPLPAVGHRLIAPPEQARVLQQERR